MECYSTLRSSPTWLSFLHSVATLGNENWHSRRSVSIRVVWGHAAVSLLLSAKFKASYARSKSSSFMCDNSGVEPQQNVTGRCQEKLCLQTLTLQCSNFILRWYRVTFLKARFLRNKVRIYCFGISSETEASIHLLLLLLLQVWGEPINKSKKTSEITTRCRLLPRQFLSEKHVLEMKSWLEVIWFDLIITEQIPKLKTGHF